MIFEKIDRVPPIEWKSRNECMVTLGMGKVTRESGQAIYMTVWEMHADTGSIIIGAWSLLKDRAKPGGAPPSGNQPGLSD